MKLRLAQLLFFGAVFGALLFAAASSAKTTASTAAWSGKPDCKLELKFKGRRYRLAQVPAKDITARKKLRGRAVFRCERSVVCKTVNPCAFDPGKVVTETHVRRVRGIHDREAVMEVNTGRLYVNPLRCGPHIVVRLLLRCLKKGGGPRFHPSDQTPPYAFLLASGTDLPLALSNYCWSTEQVRGCATFVAPWLRDDVPLVVAKRGAMIDVDLGFDPNAVYVALVGHGDEPYFSQSLPVSRDIHWTVPKNGKLPGRSYLLISAGRDFEGHDYGDGVYYFARLRIVKH